MFVLQCSIARSVLSYSGLIFARRSRQLKLSGKRRMRANFANRGTASSSSRANGCTCRKHTTTSAQRNALRHLWTDSSQRLGQHNLEWACLTSMWSFRGKMFECKGPHSTCPTPDAAALSTGDVHILSREAKGSERTTQHGESRCAKQRRQ